MKRNIKNLIEPGIYEGVILCARWVGGHVPAPASIREEHDRIPAVSLNLDIKIESERGDCAVVPAGCSLENTNNRSSRYKALLGAIVGMSYQPPSELNERDLESRKVYVWIDHAWCCRRGVHLVIKEFFSAE